MSHQYHMFKPFTCHDIWVMENEGHWAKQFKIGPLFGTLRILGFWKRDQLLLTSTKEMFLLYNIVTRERKDPSIRSPTEAYAEAFEYQETLVTINSMDRSFKSETELKRRGDLRDGRWKPPQRSFVKINIAEAYVQEEGQLGIGFIIRDELGKVVHVGGEGYSHSEGRHVGLTAIEQGILKALELNLTKVEVEMDNEKLVKAISLKKKRVNYVSLKKKLVQDGKTKVWEAQAMVEAIKRIRGLVREFNKFSVSATCEEANGCAQVIANFCKNNRGPVDLTFDPPSPSSSLLSC